MEIHEKDFLRKTKIDGLEFPNSSNWTQNDIIRFKNVFLLRNHKIIEEDLWIHRGKFIDPQTLFFSLKREADIEIDGKGLLIVPGFIDIQINGAFGIDFSSPDDVESGGVDEVARGILQHGVTAFLPTVITSQPETYKKILPLIKRRPGSGELGAEVLGVHVEGPFINILKYGAHKKEFLQHNCPDGIRTMEEVYGSLENVSIITVAPELPGILQTIPELVKRKIIVSAGHSMASIDQAEKATEEGVTLITHLFNAMIPFHHRDPGLVGLLGSAQYSPYYSIIVDGIHSHPTSVRLAYKAHPDGVILITDAMEAMGLEPGQYQLGTMQVDITRNAAYIHGTKTLAGSIATLESCIIKFIQCTGCSTVEAIEAATLHPAQLLGIEKKKGTLNFGADADFVLLNDQLNVQATFIGGNLVWEGPKRFMPSIKHLKVMKQEFKDWADV